MRGRKGTTSQWYCDKHCKPQPSPNRQPCRLCCGYTTDPHRQANPPGEVAS